MPSARQRLLRLERLRVVGLLQDFGFTIPPQLTTTPGTMCLYQYHWDRWDASGSACQLGVDPELRCRMRHGVFNLVAFLGDRDGDGVFWSAAFRSRRT